MKILISRSSSGAIGGAELSARDQAIALKKLGHEPTVVTNLPNLTEDLNSRRIPYRRTIFAQKYTKPFRYLYFLVAFPLKIVLDLISVYKLNPDIINPHTREEQIVFTWLKPLHRRPVVWKDPGDLIFQLKPNRSNPIARLYQSLLIRSIIKSDGVYVLSDKSKKHILKYIGMDMKNQIYVVPAGILYSSYSPQNKTPSKDKVVIGYVGRLHKTKGVSLLIESFIALDNSDNNTELWILGDGPEKNNLEEQAKENGNIKFLGFQSDVSSFLNSIDIFVQPALVEDWGRNITEALYFGKVVIASKTSGATKQIADGVNGRLFTPGKHEELTNIMSELLDNSQIRTQLSAKAKEMAVNKGDFVNTVEELIIPIYEKAVKSGNKDE